MKAMNIYLGMAFSRIKSLHSSAELIVKLPTATAQYNVGCQLIQRNVTRSNHKVYQQAVMLSVPNTMPSITICNL